MKERMIGIDIIRIISAFIVFLFHSNMHLGCNYGVFNDFIGMGAIFMTTFFMLSGFSLFISYADRSLMVLDNVKTFYQKRLIGILPLYYIIEIVYVLYLGNESLKENIILAPIEILGIQSFFTSLFGITHNGGTWFISCILFCYLLYPFFQENIRQISLKWKIYITCILIFILLYASFAVKTFNLFGIYSNPIFRCMEFVIGVILASAMEELKHLKWIFSVKVFLIEMVVLIIGVSAGVRLSVEVGNYMFYNWIIIPVSILLILSSSAINFRSKKIIKIITYLSSISYAFFLAQFFTWDNTKKILLRFNTDGNIHRIFTSLIVCTCVAVLLHEVIEKPIQKKLNKLLFSAYKNL